MDVGKTADQSPAVATISAAPSKSEDKDGPSNSVPVGGENANASDSKMGSVAEDNFEMDAVAASGQTLAGTNLNFFVGLKAEMLPNNGDVWYPVKIMDMDMEEREVLCHYENWASRFDEWVCVDSCRIRPVSAPENSRPINDQEFQVNQKVMATWSDNRKFPAVVKTILTDGSYEVLFMDGFRKTLKASKLTKFTRKDQEQLAKNYPKPALPAPPIGSTMAFETTPISKEERRQLKRKINVKDLFADHRKRHKSDGSLLVKKITDEDSRLKVVLKKRKSKSASDGTKTENTSHSEIMENASEKASTVPADSAGLNIENVEGQKRKRFKNRKHYYEYESPTVTSTFRKPTNENIVVNKQPFSPSIVATQREGPIIDRAPKLVPDEKLPNGWTKFRALKKCGTKFDVYIVSPEGRKCRSRSEIQQIYHEHGEEYPIDKFDFIISGRKRRIRRKHATLMANAKLFKKSFEKSENMTDKIASLSAINSPVEPIDSGRRIKTLLPKSKPLKFSDEIPKTPVPPSTPISLAASTPPQVPNSGDSGGGSSSAGFICPVQNCGKLFRKENLLMMHMKHYHAEYNQILGSTPNVADLAYARTVGQSLDDISPSTSFLDKINRLEKQKAAAVSKSPILGMAPPSPVPAPSPSRKRPENEVSEERIPFAEEKKLITQLPRRVSEPHQLVKVQKAESPVAESPKEPFVPTPEPVISDPADLDVDKQSMAVAVKKQSPVLDASPRKRRFSKYCRNSLDSENLSNSSLKSFKKRTISTSKSSTLSDYNESSLDASESGTESSSIAGPKLEQLKKEEIINCTCGYKEEDGLMIQCDLCLCWQHGMCNSIDSEEEVPEKYICYICLNPYRQRSSKQYTYNQDWLKEGSFPKFSFRSRTGSELAHRESLLKRSHSVTATLVQIESVLHSLKAKINVAEKSDHPKLYLWSKPWNDDKGSREDKIITEVKEEPKIITDENTPSGSGNIPGPQPEAPIDPLECRLRLLDHIDNYQNQIESRLTSLEAQIAALESQDPDLANDETPEFYPLTKQTIQMVMKDLQTVRRIATLS